jgi:type III secretory pathway component EscS
MTLDKVLTWFIGAWVGLVFILTMASFAGTMIAAPTFWAGVTAIQDELSPFNIKYYLTMAVLLSPALGALWWRDKRRVQHRP